MTSSQHKDITQLTHVAGMNSKPRLTLKMRIVVARGLLVLLFGLGFFLSMIPSGRATTRAALLLPSLITAAEPALLRSVNESIQHTQKVLPSRVGTLYLDVYAPSSSPSPIPGVRGGVVIIPGVGDNREVPQLVNFAQSLARTGLVVMIMTTPTLIKYDLSVQDSDAVFDAFNALASWPNVDPKRIGLISFSAGASLACFAGADPRIRDQLAFVVLFGGYFNTTTLLRAFGQRAVKVDGQIRSWRPQILPIRALSNIITRALPLPERTLLVNSFTPGGKPPAAHELARLSPPAQAAYHLLAGDTPDQVDEHLAALSSQMRAQLDELSPSRVISRVEAPIYLLHDVNDDSIPFTESRYFAAALTQLNHPHDFVEFDIFRHVQVRSGLGIDQLVSDGLNLFRLLRNVLLISS